jgi:hypothetical protein
MIRRWLEAALAHAWTGGFALWRLRDQGGGGA